MVAIDLVFLLAGAVSSAMILGSAAVARRRAVPKGPEQMPISETGKPVVPTAFPPVAAKQATLGRPAAPPAPPPPRTTVPPITPPAPQRIPSTPTPPEYPKAKPAEDGQPKAFCAQCGVANTAGAVFCKNCGARLLI